MHTFDIQPFIRTILQLLLYCDQTYLNSSINSEENPVLDLSSLDDLDEQNEKYAHMRSHTKRLTHVVPGVVVKSIDNALADICQWPK